MVVCAYILALGREGWISRALWLASLAYVLRRKEWMVPEGRDYSELLPCVPMHTPTQIYTYKRGKQLIT